MCRSDVPGRRLGEPRPSEGRRSDLRRGPVLTRSSYVLVVPATRRLFLLMYRGQDLDLYGPILKGRDSESSIHWNPVKKWRGSEVKDRTFCVNMDEVSHQNT